MEHSFEMRVRIVPTYVMQTIRTNTYCFLTHIFFTSKNTI